MYNFSQALADSIKNARMKMGLTQANVASRISIDTRTILNIENCNGNPKMEILYSLVRELNVDPWEIFYPENTDSASMRKMQLLLNDCTAEEIDALLPVCEAVLAVLKSKESVTLEKE
jgi:transcriptional regulator with XRE-family HTH domain